MGALANNQLPIWYARHNVNKTNFPPVHDWIKLDQSVSAAPGAPQYFSFHPGKTGDGTVCGRVVYSDVHVSGGPGQSANGVPGDYPGFNFGGVVPSGCAQHPLTPQEKALEFMLFDLTSCLVPPGQSPVAPSLSAGGADAGPGPGGAFDGGSEAGSEAGGSQDAGVDAPAAPVRLGPPRFSPPSGTPPLSVTINPPAGAPSSNVFLLYTTDGTHPTRSSLVYSLGAHPGDVGHHHPGVLRRTGLLGLSDRDRDVRPVSARTRADPGGSPHTEQLRRSGVLFEESAAVVRSGRTCRSGSE